MHRCIQPKPSLGCVAGSIKPRPAALPVDTLLDHEIGQICGSAAARLDASQSFTLLIHTFVIVLRYVLSWFHILRSTHLGVVKDSTGAVFVYVDIC